jgi:hypothetical protein
MTPDGQIKLVTQLLDLPLIDADETYCGVVDDVEFDGSAKSGFKLKALLVGPGAYAGRLPRGVMPLVRLIAGDRIVRVAWKDIETIGPAVRLKRPAAALGLGKSEALAEKFIPKKGAL